jgi:hypothetical protein
MVAQKSLKFNMRKLFELTVPDYSPEIVFEISLPDWTPGRMIREVVVHYNTFIHPDSPLDTVTTDWLTLHGRIHTWLRHRFTTYDRDCRDFNRDALKELVRSEACEKYPWLRTDSDPRFPQ